MTSPLQRSADIITRAAGWKEALPDDDGVFRFSLEGGLDFELLSPENRTGILLAVLGSAPENDGRSDETLQRLAQLSAGSLKKRRSTFSIGERGLELYRTFSLSEASEQSLPRTVRDFLNDLAWWKQQLSGTGSARPSGAQSSPFSFAFGDWFSSGTFQG